MVLEIAIVTKMTNDSLDLSLMLNNGYPVNYGFSITLSIFLFAKT